MDKTCSCSRSYRCTGRSASLKTVKRFEVLPYHTLGVFKWEELGIPYTLSDVMPPTKEEIARANEILKTAEYTGYLE